MYRRLELCSNRGGYEAVADPPRPIDLGSARSTLELERVPVVDARVMLIVSLETEVTISRGGRLLFKTRDRAAAERDFVRLQRMLGLSAVGSARSPDGPVG